MTNELGLTKTSKVEAPLAKTSESETSPALIAEPLRSALNTDLGPEIEVMMQPLSNPTDTKNAINSATSRFQNATMAAVQSGIIATAVDDVQGPGPVVAALLIEDTFSTAGSSVAQEPLASIPQRLYAMLAASAKDAVAKGDPKSREVVGKIVTEKEQQSNFATYLAPAFTMLQSFVRDMHPNFTEDEAAIRLKLVELVFKILSLRRGFMTKSVEELGDYLESNMFPDRMKNDELLNSSQWGGHHIVSPVPSEALGYIASEHFRAPNARSLQVGAAIHSLIQLYTLDPLNRDYFDHRGSSPPQNTVHIPIHFKHAFCTLSIDMNRPPTIDQLAHSLSFLDADELPDWLEANNDQHLRSAIKIETYRHAREARPEVLRAIHGESFARVPFNLSIDLDESEQTGTSKLFQDMSQIDNLGTLNGNDQSPIGVALQFNEAKKLVNIGLNAAHKTVYGLDDLAIAAAMKTHIGTYFNDGFYSGRSGSEPTLAAVPVVDASDLGEEVAAWVDALKQLDIDPVPQELSGTIDFSPAEYAEFNTLVGRVVTETGQSFSMATLGTYAHLLAHDGDSTHVILSKDNKLSKNNLLISVGTLLSLEAQKGVRLSRILLSALNQLTIDTDHLVDELSSPSPTITEIANLQNMLDQILPRLKGSIDAHRQQCKDPKMITIFSYLSGIFESLLSKIAVSGFRLIPHTKLLRRPSGMVSFMMEAASRNGGAPPAAIRAQIVGTNYLEKIVDSDNLSIKSLPDIDQIARYTAGGAQFDTAFSVPYMPDISQLTLKEILNNPNLKFAPITGGSELFNADGELSGAISQRYTFDHLIPDVIRRLLTELYRSENQSDVSEELNKYLEICKCLSVNAHGSKDRGFSGMLSLPVKLRQLFPGREKSALELIYKHAHDEIAERTRRMKMWMKVLPHILLQKPKSPTSA